ncbi:unnamed protein product [Commensalibacter communis]|uniref:Uncharacterized protein n=1 Tax=Commensalibacter communis TaxID=2972786 RepID=A0A9W4TNT5_9PROT|nr:hypothetical protein [Commensalibacter communis]CAI3953268.1 unnamed protein product [Commensalibacter communis]CAI3956338.1 unnamed protein product [Commensalibacter communis]CAI3956904.1 unnamed protein product [Commensalibacter communis]CAI3957316.1 unnamed protein product [Commensalibacter communis]
MDLIISDHSVPLEKADRAPKKVIDPTPQYATDGDPAQGIPATILTAAHYNSLMDEIVNAIKAGGLKPDKDNWAQLASIITEFILQIDGLNGRFGNIKEVGMDEKGVYVIVSENGTDQKTYILSPSDLDDINKRLSAAEGTIINHTSRLDNYGDAINRVFNKELPAKADLNGNSSQDFKVKELNAGSVLTGSLRLGGTNGVGTDKSLWSFSPQLLNDEAGNFSRIALFNLIYAGADGAVEQNSGARNLIQIRAHRSKYITTDPNLSENDATIHTRAISLYMDGYIYGDVSLSRNLFVARASTFTGKAIFRNGTEGTSKDLAENYKADRVDYSPGQVMMYSVRGDSEVELCSNPKQVFGVISTKPAYLMNGKENSDKHSQWYVPIVMVGRVPVLVEGPIMRKDKLTPTHRGTAIVSKEDTDIIIGRPLYDDLNEETRLVECFVKVVL